MPGAPRPPRWRALGQVRVLWSGPAGSTQLFLSQGLPRRCRPYRFSTLVLNIQIEHKPHASHTKRPNEIVESRGVQPTARGPHGARDATNAAQHKIVNLLKTFFFCSSVFVSVCVFNVWPKTTLLIPVRPRDATKLDTPGSHVAEDDETAQTFPGGLTPRAPTAPLTPLPLTRGPGAQASPAARLPTGPGRSWCQR